MAHRPHILVFGNEKGGSGKSTTAMHMAIAASQRGHRVACIDLDGRQRSLSRYLENRTRYGEANGINLAIPTHGVVTRSDATTVEDAKRDERSRFDALLIDLAKTHDLIIIDCPGADTYLARYAHAHADTLVTPVNDSFVDVDLLAKVDADGRKIVGLSPYSEMVFEARKWRAQADRGQIDWVVLRNRVASLRARNKARVEDVLQQLTNRLGFRFVPGLSERVVYRELFPKGLTLMDLRDAPGHNMGGLTMSHVAARAEVRKLFEALKVSAPHKTLQAAE